jgi:hypothetical protein
MRGSLQKKMLKNTESKKLNTGTSEKWREKGSELMMMLKITKKEAR